MKHQGRVKKSTPCQCIEVSISRLFVTVTRSISPTIAFKVGPGIKPFNTKAFASLPDIFIFSSDKFNLYSTSFACDKAANKIKGSNVNK